MTDFRCPTCNMIYDRKELVDACQESHETVYVKFTRQELFRLIQFIYTKDDQLISKDLMKKLQRYKRGDYV